MLTKQAFSDRIHTREVIARASANHQVEWAPLINLRENTKDRDEPERGGTGSLDSGAGKMVCRVDVPAVQAWQPGVITKTHVSVEEEE